MFESKNQLKEEIEKLKKEKNKINQEKLNLLKNREINYNLYNMLKAILIQLGEKEIEIDIDKIEEAKRYELYVEDSYLKYAKRLKIIEPSNIVEID